MKPLNSLAALVSPVSVTYSSPLLLFFFRMFFIQFSGALRFFFFFFVYYQLLSRCYCYFHHVILLQNSDSGYWGLHLCLPYLRCFFQDAVDHLCLPAEFEPWYLFGFHLQYQYLFHCLKEL